MQSRVSAGLHKSPTGNFRWKKAKKRLKRKTSQKTKKIKAKVHYATLGTGLLFRAGLALFGLCIFTGRERIPHRTLPCLSSEWPTMNNFPVVTSFVFRLSNPYKWWTKEENVRAYLLLMPLMGYVYRRYQWYLCEIKLVTSEVKHFKFKRFLDKLLYFLMITLLY